MLEYCSKRIVNNPHNKKIELLCADISDMPLDNSSVDAIVSSWGFPSNMWDRKLCIKQVKEAHRVLKENGVLITIGWDESFKDELSELWYRYVPEPNFRRESLEEWRHRRSNKIHSPRNCYLTFVKQNIQVPVKFDTVKESANVLGNLFGFAAGDWIIQNRKKEFSMLVSITYDTKKSLENAMSNLINSKLNK